MLLFVAVSPLFLFVPPSVSSCAYALIPLYHILVSVSIQVVMSWFSFLSWISFASPLPFHDLLIAHTHVSSLPRLSSPIKLQYCYSLAFFITFVNFVPFCINQYRLTLFSHASASCWVCNINKLDLIVAFDLISNKRINKKNTLIQSNS